MVPNGLTPQVINLIYDSAMAYLFSTEHQFDSMQDLSSDYGLGDLFAYLHDTHPVCPQMTVLPGTIAQSKVSLESH